MRLPGPLRDRLKAPLGTLLPEDRADKAGIAACIRKDSYIITVGDRTTEKMVGFGMIPSLQIVDGMEKRQKRDPPGSADASEITADNPAAEITDQSIDSIKRALAMRPPVRLRINGEEDLLVLPACLYAPENATVLYGQPDEGLVIVEVTPEIRNKTRVLLGLME